MSRPAPDGAPRLPYPHARNDCTMCRERDADFHVPARDLPNGYKALYCRWCIGEFMITQAVFGLDSDVPRGAPTTSSTRCCRRPANPGSRVRVAGDRL